VAPVPRGHADQVSYVDSLCFWSPTGEHVYQLADLDLGRGRHTVVDKCRHCGDLAFQAIRADQPEHPEPPRLWRFARRHDQGGAVRR
jgi:hypothetical protein